MKLDVKLLKQLIKEEREKSPLVAKPPTIDDIKAMGSEVLDEMVGENDES